MSDSMVQRWCRQFESVRDNVHDDKGSGCSSVVTPDLVQQIEVKIRKNTCFTITDLAEFFPNVSRKTVHRIVTKNPHFWKLCARWVLKNLTPEHKMKRIGSALSFLERYEKDGDEFLTHIVTGDETWVSHVTPESKQQSMQWCHTSSPTKKKFKQTFSARKIMCMVFWDHYGVLLLDYHPNGQTINAQVYCDTLQCLCRAMQNKRWGLLSSRVVLLHDNAHLHMAWQTTALLQQFRWDIMDHPPYSPDLAPSDYRLFLHMKRFHAGKQFHSDAEVETTVNNWLQKQAVDLFDRHSKTCDAIQQVPRVCW